MSEPQAPELDDEQRRLARAAVRQGWAEQGHRDRQQAWDEIAETARRTAENTDRLRALRLARDEARAAEPPAKARKAGRAKTAPPR